MAALSWVRENYTTATVIVGSSWDTSNFNIDIGPTFSQFVGGTLKKETEALSTSRTSNARWTERIVRIRSV